jgi:hypothetical protein
MSGLRFFPYSKSSPAYDEEEVAIAVGKKC